MKKLISFSLWGKDSKYIDGAYKNAEAKHAFYPDWVSRFYVGNDVEKKVIDCLLSIDETLEIVIMSPVIDVLGMYWRFHPMFDSVDVERFIVRDTDSLFTEREVSMVYEWIDSGKPFHIIRDCESHGTYILGGTWGAVAGCVPDFQRRLANWYQHVKPCTANPRGLFHGTDQEFLSRYIWPLIRDNHVAHVKAGVPGLKYTGHEVEVPLIEGDHYVGMVC